MINDVPVQIRPNTQYSTCENVVCLYVLIVHLKVYKNMQYKSVCGVCSHVLFKEHLIFMNIWSNICFLIFKGVTGLVQLDKYGDREIDFALWDMTDTDTGVYQVQIPSSDHI